MNDTLQRLTGHRCYRCHQWYPPARLTPTRAGPLCLRCRERVRPNEPASAVTRRQPAM